MPLAPGDRQPKVTTLSLDDARDQIRRLTARAIVAEQDRDRARDERDVANALRMGTLR